MKQEVLADRYRLDRVMGTGGMATVYSGHDLFLDRPVAVKVMRSRGGFSRSEREEFLREARTVAALNHPNIIGIYDAGIAGATPFLVMELLTGITLRQKLLNGPLGPVEALRVTERMASALEA